MQDLTTLLENITPMLERGRYPEKAAGKKIARPAARGRRPARRVGPAYGNRSASGPRGGTSPSAAARVSSPRTAA
ncbi:hypothetical protein STANM309S_04297 [Streptomyces tanashiensis]